MSLKEIPSNLCLLGIGTPEVSNLSLAFTAALVFSQSRLFLSPKPHQRPLQDCEEAPLSSQPINLWGNFRYFALARSKEMGDAK